MSSITSESPQGPVELLQFCRLSTTLAWQIALVAGVVVTLISLAEGAQLTTAILRGAVTLFVFGLIGWGINAVLVAASHAAAREEAERLSSTRPQARTAAGPRGTRVDASVGDDDDDKEREPERVGDAPEQALGDDRAIG